ncbi:hypothetical protein K438DRAFT_1765855 [Mycena galopus ATCC 62051]|nr:hypothetical protein K438DRAFT_1765855 [Mycena galopus ATCC 62051]
MTGVLANDAKYSINIASFTQPFPSCSEFNLDDSAVLLASHRKKLRVNLVSGTVLCCRILTGTCKAKKLSTMGKPEANKTEMVPEVRYSTAHQFQGHGTSGSDGVFPRFHVLLYTSEWYLTVALTITWNKEMILWPFWRKLEKKFRDVAKSFAERRLKVSRGAR